MAERTNSPKRANTKQANTMRARRRLAGILVLGAGLCTGTALAQSGGIGIPREEQPEREEQREQRGEQRGAVDLRPRFEKGQELRYKLEMNSTSGVVQPQDIQQRRRPATPGHDDRTRNDVEFGLLLRVKDVNEMQEATVDIVMESIRFKIDGPDMTAEFDSRKPNEGDEMMAMVMKSLVGTTMTATIDRTGNIKRIAGGEALAALGQMGMPGAGGAGGTGSGGGGGAGGLFGPIFSPKSGTGFARIGESWENADVIDSGLLGKFRMNTRHTLRRMQGRDAIVEVRGVYRMDSEAGGNPMARIKDSNYSGNYTWDTGSGSLKQLNTAMVSTAEQTIGDETREIKSESAVKVTRVD